MEEKRGLTNLLHSRSFWTRAVTGISVCAVLALIFILGYTVMLCVLGILSLMGLWELFKAQGLLWKPFAITAIIVDVLYYILIRFFDRPYISLYMVFLFALFAITNIIIYVITYATSDLHDVFASFFGVFYVGVSLSFLYITRVHPWGAYLVWLAIISSWGCDVCAYLVGMLIGKHRIFPQISPKKTIEGCIGGIIGSGILAFVYAICVKGYILDLKNEMIIFPIVCMAGAVIGMFGDLFASAIKRKVGIKDYSSLLPGHGGILDRFDSVILVSPIIFVVTILIRLLDI